MNITFQLAKLAAVLAVGAGIATAGPIITLLYDPNVAFTAADKTQIQNAVDFYTSNIASNFAVTVAVGAQTGGGASTSSFSTTVDYIDYYNALVGASSGNATDTAAVASLGGANVNNPVTGSALIKLKPTLASALGLGAQISDSFSECGNLTANACIRVGADVLNLGGTPMGSLFGTFEHEFDEVLGTSSALRATAALPADPSVADLFRYGAPTVRSFSLNTSTDVPCTGSPTAYLSINNGATNLNPYNNCNNGGDYGDWIFTDGLQVQDAYGPDDVASSLALNSPEVTLLDSVGYNFNAINTAPEPSSVVLVITGLIAAGVVRRRRAAKLRT